MQAGADAELVQRLEARQEQLLKKLESLHSVVQKTRESLSIGMEKGTPSTRQISASSVSALVRGHGYSKKTLFIKRTIVAFLFFFL